MNSNKGSDNIIRPGKFIVVEGSDSSGKQTQTKLLAKHLKRTGIELELLSFPQYDEPFGELVGKYLRGEFGSLEDVKIEIPSLLYALDRFQVRDKIVDGLRAGKWFIADRYTGSNLAHQGAKLFGQAREDIMNWIEQVEHRLPKPDLVIYLHVPVELSKKLMASRAPKSYLADATDKDQDIHEQDSSYQQKVVELYLELASKRDEWVVIDCMDHSKNKIESIEIIHHRIAKIVESRFGLKPHH